MDTNEQMMDFLPMLKALAQDKRLMIMALTGDAELSVGEIAAQLELTEPTASHHISKLHGVGLLRLRMAGNQRFYRANEERLAVLRRYIGEIDQLPVLPETVVSDDSWIDDLPFDDFVKDVLRTHTVNGRLRKIPSKRKKFLAVMEWLASKFEPGQRYSEAQVSEVMKSAHDDYATLRRGLVAEGYMRRERGGGDYWLTPEDDTP